MRGKYLLPGSIYNHGKNDNCQNSPYGKSSLPMHSTVLARNFRSNSFYPAKKQELELLKTNDLTVINNCLQKYRTDNIGLRGQTLLKESSIFDAWQLLTFDDCPFSQIATDINYFDRY